MNRNSRVLTRIFLVVLVLAVLAYLLVYLFADKRAKEEIKDVPRTLVTAGAAQQVCPLGEVVVRTFPPREGNVQINLDTLEGPRPLAETAPCVEDEGDPTFNVLVGAPGGVTVPEPPSDPLPIDRQPPLVAGVPLAQPNAAGWFKAPVTVDWSSADPEPSAGTPTKPAPTIIATEGRDQIVTSEPSCDPARNCATGSVNVSVDSTPPSITVTGNAGTYSPTQTVTIGCNASDSLSGLATNSCPTVSGVAASFGPGPHSYIATATDKAGNTSTTNFSFTVSAPVWPPSSSVSIGAVFTTGSAGAVFSGAGHKVFAKVHSESSVQVSGSGHSFTGGMEYVSTLAINGAGTVLNPLATKVAAGLVPTTVTVADYRPGSPARTVLGGSLQPIPVSKCVGGAAGTWTPNASELTNSTVYYVPCGVTLAGAGLTKTVSFVAEGPIKVTGAGVSLLAPFPNTPALLSGSTSGEAVSVSGANVTVQGSIRTPGGITISGASSTVCSLLGSTVNVRGANTKIAAC
jgi:hypothetical protein